MAGWSGPQRSPGQQAPAEVWAEMGGRESAIPLRKRRSEVTGALARVPAHVLPGFLLAVSVSGSYEAMQTRNIVVHFTQLPRGLWEIKESFVGGSVPSMVLVQSSSSTVSDLSP